MIVNFMNRDELCTVIHVDYRTKEVRIENKIDDPLLIISKTKGRMAEDFQWLDMV